MAGTVLDIDELLGPMQDNLARSISKYWIMWETFRNTFMTQKAELRNYLFATDTSTTTNKSLPWKNSTTIPKLTQIRDNLIANYMAALFPSEDWLIWEGAGEEAETEAKRGAIQAYMRTKLRQDKAEITINRLICDYVDDGNCIATAEWVDESLEVEGPTALSVQRGTGMRNGNVIDYPPAKNTNPIRGYVGPRIVRISMKDIVFNPTAPRFEMAPKIIKAIKTLGELAKIAEHMPTGSDAQKMLKAAIDKSVNVRRQVAALGQGDTFKGEGFQMDGFSDIRQYWGGDTVEILTFYGDMYDVNTGELYENHVITVMDRSFLISKKQNPSWMTTPGIFHAGWRLRPDNLYAMGPLDNLVGMQYRIDHLENLKADVFDFIAYPMQLISGYVEDYEYEPGTKIIAGEDGKVQFLNPPHEALNADTQIAELERRMEELAGAPKEAMGIRSPGEKTKFEVQKLDNAASRIFQSKIEHFQKVFLDPLLNYMLSLARQNMSGNDVTRSTDSEIDAVIFATITKEDITANGVLRPIGAEHFAERANALQNLVTASQSPLMQDQSVQTHISGKGLALALTDLMGLEKYHLFGENIRVIENAQTKQLLATTSETADTQASTPPGLSEGDPASPQATKVTQMPGSVKGTPNVPIR